MDGGALATATRALGRLIGWLSTASALLGALAIVLMMCQIMADVVLKNLFSAPIPLTSVLVAHWYMVGAAFLPVAMTEMLDRHISVEVAFLRLSPRWRRRVGGLACLAGAVVTAGLTRALWIDALRRWESGSFIVEQSVSMPIWQTYFFLPLGFGLLTLVLLYRTLVSWTGLPSGMGEAPLDRDPDPVSEGV